MHKYSFAAFGLILSYSFCVFAADKIDSFEWRQKLQSEFVLELCEPKGHARSCYEISDVQCKNSATKNFDVCAKTTKFPRVIAPLTEGLTIAHKLGRCAGRKMDKEFKIKKKSDPICYQASKWD